MSIESCGRILGLGLIAMFVLGFAPCRAADEPAVAYESGVLIHFDGMINKKLEWYVNLKLDDAEEAGADLVIIEIDSPGGYVDSSLQIATRLRDISWARTVAYVPREALSGAAIVALGCDEIVIGPSAVIGDAGAIEALEVGGQWHYVSEKARTDLARKVRDLAEAKGRPPALAEAMVDMDLVVWQVKNTETGETTYMADHEIESDPRPDRWEKGPRVGEAREGKFLEANGRRAVELGLANANAVDRGELIERYRLPGPPRVCKLAGIDTVVYILNSPWITGLLFVIGMIALYVELSAPGIGVGGLTAVLCFAIFFWSRVLGMTAGWLEIILFVAGLMFLAVELFVLPGFGVAGLGGILLLLISIVLASQNFVIPETSLQMGQLIRTLLTVAVSGLICTFAMVYLSSRMGTLPVFNRLVLKPPQPGEGAGGGADEVPGAGDDESGDGGQLAAGRRGIAQSALRPAGKVRFGKRYADVVTDAEFINKNAQVEIVEIIGNRIVVREVE